MSRLSTLKSAATLSDVASLLGFKPAALSYILYKAPVGAKYTKFEIPKKYGGTRHICAPSAPLKLLQRRLADLLQDCVEQINTANGFADTIAHGFKRRRSIITNARQHRGRRFVFNIDLNNFFGTINFGRVRGFLCKDKNFELNDAVATILAQIVCFENALPQGSPTSPVVSNLIAHVLDIHLVRLAARYGCTYTRYADDLTFSTNAELFPNSIAVCEDAATHKWIPGPKLETLVLKSGFEINPNKTRMQYRRSRQDVTGLTVNQKVNTRKQYRHTVRAMVHRLVKTGNFHFTGSAPDGAGGVATQEQKGTFDQLQGMLGFIDGVDRYNDSLEKNKKKEHDAPKLSARDRVYRDFLLYSQLYAAPRPVLIGEGPTDYVYLLHAIRSLATKYPKLATVHSTGEVTVNTRIYKYSGSNTDRILRLQGGSAHLSGLIRDYHKERQQFGGPGATQPIVLVIDNDSGSKSVYTAIEHVTKKKPSKTDAFIHVTGNLYVVATPLKPGDMPSRMEDFFSDAIKATVVDGKSFDESSNIDSASHYGKTVFAHKVVKPNADTIDFSGFGSLLDRIVAVLDEHANKVAAAVAVSGAP